MAQDAKPRLFQDGRDMLFNVVVVVALMLVGVGATGLCTYNPGKPEQGPVQVVDAQTFLNLEARAVDFPVRYPQMPAGWVTNSARRSMVGNQPAPVVGWVTPDGGFLQLTQTGASAADAIAAQDSHTREQEVTAHIDDADVRILSSQDPAVRDLWVVDTGQSRLIATGAGDEAEFRLLLEATLAAAPISPQDPTESVPG